MTPARRKALEWFHGRGAVPAPLDRHADKPSDRLIAGLITKGLIALSNEGWHLTDKGRRMLHGDRE
jgi:hypothetical protein